MNGANATDAAPLVVLRSHLYQQLAGGHRFVRIGDVLKALERHGLDEHVDPAPLTDQDQVTS